MKMSTIRVEEFECQQRTMTTIEGIEANDKRDFFMQILFLKPFTNARHRSMN